MAEILQTEAEMLAAEIEDGIDPVPIDGLERGMNRSNSRILGDY